MILVARDVTARYRPQQAAALQSVTCEVAGAELVAVVGPNGSGKTTLMRAMLGLVRLERGTVLIDGRPLREWSRRALARRAPQPTSPRNLAPQRSMLSRCGTGSEPAGRWRNS